MSTRAIIASELAGGRWHGRYAHWDNYPHRVVPLLAELRERDGLAKVVQTLLHDHNSWSVITTEPRDETMSDNYCEGYGIFHTDTPDDEYSWYAPEDKSFSWADYVYVMRRDGVTVYSVRGLDENQSLEEIANYSWADAMKVSA
jgi:hypothetical protein